MSVVTDSVAQDQVDGCEETLPFKDDTDLGGFVDEVPYTDDATQAILAPTADRTVEIARTIKRQHNLRVIRWQEVNGRIWNRVADRCVYRAHWTGFPLKKEKHDG